MPQFTFEVEGLAQQLRVAGFSGSERLSQPFHFTLELASENGDIEFSAVVGKPAVLTLLGMNKGKRYVNGIVAGFGYSGSSGRFTLYTAELVPRFRLLSHRYNNRIFQDKNVPDILAQVLNDAGISSDDYRFVWRNEYAPRAYCVQYHESDQDFLCRLMEEEGMFFFFEHTDKNHVLVMSDDQTAHVPITAPAEVMYHERHGTVPTEEYLYQFRYTEEIQPGAVMLEDFNFERPALELRVQSQAEVNTTLEKYDYPGRYVTPEVGQRLAQVRLEELQVPRKVAHGAGACRRFVPGYRFRLERYPRSSLNRQEYLLTRVDHKATQTEVLEEQGGDEQFSYANEFACIPAAVPFRPPRITPRPVMQGSQTAIVVGPEGEEIYTDKDGHGRVKVQFHWDREGKRNENSSCWIRVSHPWAGKGWGAIAIPRIGQEVIVDFLEGDPDQPIITGRVYNGEQIPPYDLPNKPMLSGMKSNSTPGGTPGGRGYNEFVMDDTDGQELLRLHGQKDMDSTIEHDLREHVRNNRSRDVAHNESITIGHNRTETVGGTETLSVGLTRTHSVGVNEMINVGIAQEVNVGGAQTITVGGAQLVTVGLERAVTVLLRQDVNIGGNLNENVRKSHNEDVTEDRTTKIGKNLTIEVGDQILIRTGQASILMQKDGTITIEGNNITIKGSGDIVLNGKVIDLN